MCFVRFSQIIATISLNRIDWFIFVLEALCLLYAKFREISWFRRPKSPTGHKLRCCFYSV